MIGCLGNSAGLFIRITVVIIEEKERDVSRLNNLEDCKINSPCNIQYLSIARNERPKIMNAFFSLNFLVVFCGYIL